MTIKPLLITIPFVLALAGCASTTPSSSGQADQPSAQVALEMADTTTATTQAGYLLDAANQYLNNHQRALAAQVFERIQVTDLKPDEKNTWQIIKARLAFNNKHYAHALTDLDAGNFQPGLTSDQLTLIALLKARAYAGLGNVRMALEAYCQSLQTTAPDQQMATMVKLWRLLQDTPEITLQSLQGKANNSPQAQGWLALALIADQTINPADLAKRLSQWKAQFPDHLANQMIQLNQQTKLQMPHHITLMLPLSGPLAASGQAIRNAFFASFYQRPKDAGNLHIDVVDTQSAPVQQLYQQALAQGSDFIVGPLTKTNVAALAQFHHFTVPVLALNSLPAGSAPIANFYQFGLSPIDEATQTAQRAWKEGNGPASAMITPDNSWGNGITQAFTQQWQSLGGIVRASMVYSDRQSLYAKIQDLLQLNQSHQRTRLLENTLGEHVRALPRIRQDLTMIFMAAMPDMARQITPLLKFYYAGGIPVYALSTIYTGQAHTATDQDLDGVIFSDMPFVLLTHFPTPFPYAKVRTLCQTLYPKNFPANQKLYALGIDAFNLTQQLNTLKMMPMLGLYGASGQLYLTPDHAIYRRLLWAQMLHGEPHLLVN